MEQKDLELVVKKILEEMTGSKQNNDNNSNEKKSSSNTMTYKNYPLGEKSRDKLFTPTGKKIDDITLEKLANNQIDPADVRITPETLIMQAEVAESVGRIEFAQNLRRASELIAVPDERILEIYNALRPYRSTKAELLEIADELENKYGCKVNAAFVRESAEVCEARGRLKED